MKERTLCCAQLEKWSVAVTHLVWMLDMDTEAQLLQDSPFCFDDLVFGIYVVLIKYQ